MSEINNNEIKEAPQPKEKQELKIKEDKTKEDINPKEDDGLKVKDEKTDDIKSKDDDGLQVKEEPAKTPDEMNARERLAYVHTQGETGKPTDNSDNTEQGPHTISRGLDNLGINRN
jgi:hypothetical protein